jgi:hypothetical protein
VASLRTHRHLLAGCFYLLLARKRKCSASGARTCLLLCSEIHSIKPSLGWLEGERFAAGEQVFSLRVSLQLNYTNLLCNCIYTYGSKRGLLRESEMNFRVFSPTSKREKSLCKQSNGFSSLSRAHPS